jgi:hypothetical protein
MGTGSFPGVKRPGRGADHPPPSSAEVRKEYSYTSTPPLGLRACYGVPLPLHYFNNGFLITRGQLHFIQSSVIQNKCFTQLHYAHSPVTSHGPKMILYLLVVDDNGYAPHTRTLLPLHSSPRQHQLLHVTMSIHFVVLKL